MAKILLLTILLVIVYQFDDLVRAAHFAYTRIRHQKYRQLLLDSDHYVGTFLGLTGMPMSLNYLLVSDRPLGDKLLILGGLFLLTATLATGLGVFLRRLKHAQRYEGVTALVGMGYAVAGLFHPVMQTVQWHGGRARRDLAKLAFLLSIPAFLGFGFKWFFGQYDYQDGFIRYMDVLIIVMVGGMFIHAVISPARRYLRSGHMNLLGFVRVVAGLAITGLLFL